MSRFVVGIDLGTTNCALAFAEPAARRRRRADDQAPADPAGRRGERRRRPAGPAVVPLSPLRQGVRRRGRSTCPGRRAPSGVVGTFARDHGAKVPGRLVGSAKSWLSHAGVDREESDPPVGTRRGGRQSLARRGVDGVPGPPPRRLEPRDRRQVHRRPARTAGRLAHGPRLVRRRRPRVDRRGRPRRRAGERDPPGGAASRLLCLARRPGGPVAEAGQGRRSAPGLRRRRRDDRLHADRRDRPGGRPRPDPAGGRRAHPARRRQHGPRPGPCRRGDVAQWDGRARFGPAGGPRPCLPGREGDALRRAPARRRPPSRCSGEGRR